jgi:hypothetical protein
MIRGLEVTTTHGTQTVIDATGVTTFQEGLRGTICWCPFGEEVTTSQATLSAMAG